MNFPWKQVNAAISKSSYSILLDESKPVENNS